MNKRIAALGLVAAAAAAAALAAPVAQADDKPSTVDVPLQVQPNICQMHVTAQAKLPLPGVGVNCAGAPNR